VGERGTLPWVSELTPALEWVGTRKRVRELAEGSSARARRRASRAPWRRRRNALPAPARGGDDETRCPRQRVAARGRVAPTTKRDSPAPARRAPPRGADVAATTKRVARASAWRRRRNALPAPARGAPAWRRRGARPRGADAARARVEPTPKRDSPAPSRRVIASRCFDARASPL
jgi:hypothetical protein